LVTAELPILIERTQAAACAMALTGVR
jgi:hypothetical protein